MNEPNSMSLDDMITEIKKARGWQTLGQAPGHIQYFDINIVMLGAMTEARYAEEHPDWAQAIRDDYAAIQKEADERKAVIEAVKLAESSAVQFILGLTEDERSRLKDLLKPPVVKEAVVTEAETAEAVVSQEEATDVDKQAQAARATKYGIAVKPGKAVTKPKEWASVADGDFADPVNYAYPLPDAEQAMVAMRYFNHDGQRADGGYTPEEWTKIGHRIIAKLKGEYKMDGEKIVAAQKESVQSEDKPQTDETANPPAEAPVAEEPAAA